LLRYWTEVSWANFSRVTAWRDRYWHFSSLLSTLYFKRIHLEENMHVLI